MDAKNLENIFSKILINFQSRVFDVFSNRWLIETCNLYLKFFKKLTPFILEHYHIFYSLGEHKTLRNVQHFPILQNEELFNDIP